MTRYVVVAALATALGFAAGWLVHGSDEEAAAAGGTAGDADRTAAGGAVGSSATERGGAPGGDPAGRRTATDPPHAGPARASPAASPGATSAAGMAALDATAARQALRIAQLEGRLRDAEARLAEVQRTGRPLEALAGATAAERRAEAARNGNMLVEFPQWSDNLGLSDEQAAKHGLSDAEREALDRMYREFYAQGMAELKRLYRELTGDPQAGESSTLNALLHDVIELSPQEPCRTRMAEALRLLAVGQPLPAPAADAPPCETAIWFLFQSVDRMERALAALGPAARDALWSSRSTFSFSGRSDDD